MEYVASGPKQSLGRLLASCCALPSVCLSLATPALTLCPPACSLPSLLVLLELCASEEQTSESIEAFLKLLEVLCGYKFQYRKTYMPASVDQEPSLSFLSSDDDLPFTPLMVLSGSGSGLWNQMESCLRPWFAQRNITGCLLPTSFSSPPKLLLSYQDCGFPSVVVLLS